MVWLAVLVGCSGAVRSPPEFQAPEPADPEVVIHRPATTPDQPDLDEAILRRRLVTERVRGICACLEIRGQTLVELTLESQVVVSVRVNGTDVATPCVTTSLASPIVVPPPAVRRSRETTEVVYPFNGPATTPTLDRICRDASISGIRSSSIR
jgi:hypothetical protein